MSGIDEDIDGLQEWLCFCYGCQLVSPVLGESWRWFRIQRQELAHRAEKARRKSLYEEAERQLNSGPRLGPPYILLAG